jgi:dihydrofolate synthase/folylpolyglutamate synthase
LRYRRILKYLYARERLAMRLGLEGIRRLLIRLGNPEAAYPSVLVAGSNGKGCTAAMIASILKAAGYKTGLYTSPHLIDFKERIRVDGKCIDEERIESLMAMMRDAIDEERSSFFEATTAMALKHFEERKVDVAVLEVGLGGRLDATNAAHPAVSVITSISREHTEVLGASVESIAAEKAGILRPGGNAVVGFDGGIAADAIKREAQALGASVWRVGADVVPRVLSVSREGTCFTLRWKGDWEWGPAVQLSIPGRHQARNASAAALAATSLSEAGFHVSRDHVVKGIKRVRWPGRFQVLGHERSPCVLDVAHNPGAADALAGTFQEIYPGRSAVVVVGMSADKDHGSYVKALVPITAELIATEAPNVRALPVGMMARVAEEAGVRARAVPHVKDAVSIGREIAAGRGAPVLVAGSFFVVGEAMALLGVGVGERIF